MNEMVDRDRRPVIRHFRDVFPDVVVQSDLAVERQEGDARRGELLRVRTDVIHQPRRVRNVVIEVRLAVAALVDEAPVLEHA